MQEQLLESAEFYHRRYRNFSTLVIVPILVFVIAAVLFAGFAPKESAIKSRGEVKPSAIISRVYSTNSVPILINNLEQNRFIEKGDKLLTYQNGSSEIEIEHLQNQIEEATLQLIEADTLVTAIKYGDSAVFTENDYGYKQILADYESQVAQLELSRVDEINEREQLNNQITNTHVSINNEIKKLEYRIDAYIDVREAIENGETLSKDHLLYSVFVVYRDQLKEATRKEAVTNQILLEIDSQIQQLDNSLASFKTQLSNAGSVVTTSSSSLEVQKAALTSQFLLQIKQDRTQLNSRISELEARLSIQREQLNRQQIVAPESGILHLNEELMGSEIIPEGTPIGEIYPVLEDNSTIQIETYLFSQEISDIKVEDTVRFRIPVNGLLNGMELKGKITEIDYAASRTEQGNVYKVIGEVKLDSASKEVVRYGLEGEVLLITGKTTYLEYYIDRFINR
jgi:competence factor transport accessory protein ComB